jgi:hypothetical protein
MLLLHIYFYPFSRAGTHACLKMERAAAVVVVVERTESEAIYCETFKCFVLRLDLISHLLYVAATAPQQSNRTVPCISVPRPWR